MFFRRLNSFAAMMFFLFVPVPGAKLLILLLPLYRIVVKIAVMKIIFEKQKEGPKRLPDEELRMWCVETVASLKIAGETGGGPVVDCSEYLFRYIRTGEG
jgi:hypothetical protein